MQLESRSRARPIVALLLAGRIRPSPILDAIGIHELCLPIGPEGRLRDAWLRKLSEIPQLQQARVIVNTRLRRSDPCAFSTHPFFSRTPSVRVSDVVSMPRRRAM